MRYLKQTLDEFTTWKWIFLMVILFPYGWSIRTTVVANANLQQLPLNQWDIIFTFLSNPFLNIYFYLPFWLFFSSRLIIKEWDYTLLIRIKSFPKWILYTMIRISPILLILQFLWIVISFLVTMGIPPENSWSIWGSTATSLNNFIFTLQLTGLSPWLVLFLQTALLSLFLITLHVIMASVYVLFPKMSVIAGMGLFLFIGTIISYKVVPDQFNLGRVSNYIILAFSYFSFGSVLPAFIVLTLIITVCFALVILWSKGQFQYVSNFVSDNYRFIVYSLICLIGIASPFINSGMEDMTVWENLYFHFYGVSEDGFSFYVYIYFCIVFLGFVYLFQLHLSHIMDGYIYYLMIRYKSLYRWFGQLMKKTILGVVALLLLLAGITIVLGLMQGRTLEPYATQIIAGRFPYLLYQFFVNGLLQMLNYILIVFIVSWIWQEATYSLIALGVLIVTGLPFLNIHQWLPSGLNSMGYITGDGRGIFHITIVLAIYLLIELGIIFYLFSKRKISF
ncbi:hypothetical protein [Paenibacillus sp. IHBB 10380]|uniref:hypothetical protein n=1 Tax=Paenibacillus sp. IHBB 10380 TaxID=1566358 RepID=UPI0005CFA411|nr:hypothetical protein [Paenibacillus sp. IHBB 10380]AJS61207.1 hypothetical protein UB51_25325 [Paenibacillus sp. IHBB 10380]